MISKCSRSTARSLKTFYCKTPHQLLPASLLTIRPVHTQRRRVVLLVAQCNLADSCILLDILHHDDRAAKLAHTVGAAHTGRGGGQVQVPTVPSDGAGITQNIGRNDTGLDDDAHNT